MAKFNDMIVTQNGKIQYANAIAGKQIRFTKAEIGSGKPNSQEEAETLTALVNRKVIASIDVDTEAQEGVAVITISINNATVVEDIEMREIGLFCLDPDTNEEVMYAYCYAPNDTDVLPSITNGEMVWRMQLSVYITNATGNDTEGEVLAPAWFTEHISTENIHRAIYVSTTEPKKTDGNNGDIWIVYEN